MSSPSSEPPQPWRSFAAVEPQWSPPPTTPSPAARPDPGRKRRWWLWLSPVVALIVLIAAVAALGGFRERTDRLTRIAVGATMSTGPFDYTFTRATAQQRDDLGKTIFQVDVYGTAQNTTKEGRGPSVNQFAARDLVDPQVVDAEATHLGTSTDYTVGLSLNPGLPPTPFRVEFQFPANWHPSDTLRLGTSAMTEEKLFLGQDQPNWQNDDTYFQVYLPMQTLAPKKR